MGQVVSGIQQAVNAALDQQGNYVGTISSDNITDGTGNPIEGGKLAFAARSSFFSSGSKTRSRIFAMTIFMATMEARSAPNHH